MTTTTLAILDAQETKARTYREMLEVVEQTAEQTALEQQRVAASARALRQQARERPWSMVFDRSDQPLLHLMGGSVRRLGETNSRFRAALARALAIEGLSTRQIAARLGVTHQRISAMLGRAKG